MDNVLDIFYEYSINNRLLDRKAISKILDIILKINKFNNKISYVITKDSKIDLANIQDSNILGEFDMDSIIYIYYWEILKSIRKKKYMTKYDRNCHLSDNDLIIKKNIFILETIFHEIEHVKQLNIIKDVNDKSLESFLYKYEYNYIYPYYDNKPISYYIKLIKHEFIYNMNYGLSFMERMANINAYEEIYRLLVNMGNNYSKLYDIQKDIIDDYMIKEYKDGLSGPTIRFISNTGGMHEFIQHNINEYVDVMNLDDRIRYGFKITEDEYKKKIKK